MFTLHFFRALVTSLRALSQNKARFWLFYLLNKHFISKIKEYQQIARTARYGTFHTVKRTRVPFHKIMYTLMPSVALGHQTCLIPRPPHPQNTLIAFGHAIRSYISNLFRVRGGFLPVE